MRFNWETPPHPLPLMMWDTTLEVGIPHIDADHRRLFGIANALYCIAKDPKDKDGILQVLEDLISYTKEHFQKEESLLESLETTDLLEHKKAHASFISELQKLILRFEIGWQFNLDDFVTFMRLWLQAHIKETDRKSFKSYIEKVREILETQPSQ